MNKNNLPKCEHCNKEFMPRTAWQKFCSAYCKLAAWRKQNKPGKAK